MRKATRKLIAELEAERDAWKKRVEDHEQASAELADEFDAFARAHRLAANAGVDTNSRLAASRRGRAKSYNECADKLRSRFKIRPPQEE